MLKDEINIRPANRNDREKVFLILKTTDFFRHEELLIAYEVFDSSVKPDSKDGYISYVSEKNNIVTGWVCFGATPCTRGTFDIYWIAVDPTVQSKGIGGKLLSAAEKEIKKLQGRLITVDTSGTQRYNPTRRFYEKNGYRQAACLKDFYNTNDSKIIYLKQVV